MINLAGRRTLLHRVLRHATASLYRDFYRQKMPDIVRAFPRTEEEWQSVPFLTKQELVNRDLSEYTYAPLKDIDGIRMSSGTSGVGLVPIPYTKSIFTTTGRSHHPQGMTTMTLYYPGFLNEHTSLPCGSVQHRVIFGDPVRLEESALLAAEAGVDALLGAPAQMLRFAVLLEKNYAIERIKRMTTGMFEPCSRNELIEIFAAYPGLSEVTLGYGASELKSIASCRIGRESSASANLWYRGVPECHIEIVDSDGLAVAVGETGEIVVTRFEGLGCPLVRYRLGDSAILRGHEDGETLFELRGRVMEERVRIPGGEVLLVELERVLTEAVGQATVFEAAVKLHSSGLPYLSVTLFTYRYDGALPDDSDLAQRLSDSLRVNAQRTYTDGVKAGLYAPIECRSESFPQASFRKRKRLSDLRG